MGRVVLLATGERLVGKGVRAFNSVLEEVLRSASREIQIAVYRIDTSAMPLLDILEEAARKGVRVLIILSAMDEQPAGIRKRLERSGRSGGVRVVDFRSGGGGLLHAKTVVVDRQRAIIGSANLTWGGLIHNYEIGILVEGPEAWEIARMLDILAEAGCPEIYAADQPTV
ncbi:phospholipase D family protein [uncultured Thermanaerothrix sp.]|uniref:phospholipase D family protein n=1 Tax=uncultured Thermanaerothrix sp. TaxID=1195149 RepID=UPI0026217A87|nr:phospholipase D family protein [uncultured Thermanaerothrix sp.]